MLRHKTNPQLVQTVIRLRRAGRDASAPIWRAVAKQLERPTRVWPAVNVGHIARTCESGQTVVVPGKVLGGGIVDRDLTVAAWSFSGSAREKLEAAGGRCLTYDELLKERPDGSQLRLVG